MKKPIKVFYSPLTGIFYASQHYNINADGVTVITGKKYDVTNDIGEAITKHGIQFHLHETLSEVLGEQLLENNK